jgi:hypothetical protein
MIDVDDIKVKVYPPKVTVQNNIFPPPEELQNCRTCIKGRRLPADAMSKEDYHYYCRWDLKTHIGLKNYDNDCGYYIRKRMGD